MLLADRLVAVFIMALSAYFMWYAYELPIGWNGMTGGPGGGAFGFWLSAVMLITSGGVLVRSLRKGTDTEGPFFDPDMLRSVIVVILSLIITVAVMAWAGAYVALPLFVLWYLRSFGKQSWILSVIMTIATPIFLFFFFEVTLRILLPKGFTEPLFIPLYAQFF